MKLRMLVKVAAAVGILAMGLASPAAAAPSEPGSRLGTLLGSYDVQIISGHQVYVFSDPGECGVDQGFVEYRFKGVKPPKVTVDEPGNLDLDGAYLNSNKGPYPWYSRLGLAGTAWVAGKVDANSVLWSQVDGSCIGYLCIGVSEFGTDSPRSVEGAVPLMFTTQQANTKDALGITGRFDPLQDMELGQSEADACNPLEAGTMVQSSMLLPTSPDMDVASSPPSAYYLSKSAKSCWPAMWCAKLPKAKLAALKRGKSIVVTLQSVSTTSPLSEGGFVKQEFTWKVRITRKS